MVVESDVLGSCPLLKSIARQKVNLTPIKSGMVGPVIFISQRSPGVFCLGLTNHSLSPSRGRYSTFLRGSCFETLGCSLR
jgi:hypothetical protein